MEYEVNHREGNVGEHRYNSVSGFAMTVRDNESGIESVILCQTECVGEAAGSDILSTSASVQIEKTIKRALGESDVTIDTFIRRSGDLIERILSAIVKDNQTFEDKNTECAYAVSFSLLFAYSNHFWLYRIGRGNAYIKRRGEQEYSELPRNKGAEIMAAGDIILRDYVGTAGASDADFCTGVFEQGDELLLCAGNTSMPTETVWETVVKQIEENQSAATMVDLWQIRHAA